MKNLIPILFFILPFTVFSQDFVFGDGQRTVKSTLNSSSSLLGAYGVFTGTGERNQYEDMMVTVVSDQAGSYVVQVSEDGSTWGTIGAYTYSPVKQNRPHRFTKGDRWVRVIYTNGSVGQGQFSINTHFGRFEQLNAPLNGIISEDADAIVVRQNDYRSVSAGKVDGSRIIHKFGRNIDVDGQEDIWSGGGTFNGFPTSTATEFVVVSSSALDVDVTGTGAREVVFFYLDSDYNMYDDMGVLLSDTVALNGIVPVLTGTVGMRVWRAVVIESGAGGENAGDISIYWSGSPATEFIEIPTGSSQSESTAFTIPNGYTGYLTDLTCYINDSGDNRSDVVLNVREFGTNTFRLTQPFTISTTAPTPAFPFEGGLVLSEKTDIILTALNVTSLNGRISGRYTLLLERN